MPTNGIEVNPAKTTTAWGALLAGLVNSALFTAGSAFLSSPVTLLVLVGLTSIAAGFVTPKRPAFATVVLTLTGPLVFGHSSVPLGGIGLNAFSGCLPALRRGACLHDSAFAVSALALGFACTYPIYWLLVQFGRQLYLRFRKRFPD